MITNRSVKSGEFSADEGPLTYWTSTGGGDARKLKKDAAWKKLSPRQFAQALRKEVDAQFPTLPDAEHEGERHIALFVHGFNNSAEDALGRYLDIQRAIFDRHKLGLCVLFTWPSDGLKVGYYPDRKDARASAEELAEVLILLYDFLAERQEASLRSGLKTCTAKTSVIAHSMGSYVLQKAMQTAWTRKNQPLLLSLINQLVMVAADVDNDLFSSGEEVDGSDGDAIANLTYRVTALYSGLDSTLGLSAGFKHFGKRRLGRSGLSEGAPVPDNVWAADCSKTFRNVKADNIHSAYFDVRRTQDLVAAVLRGVDRGIIREQFPELA
jgi:esterase/lipase superfamily enzyme